MRLVRDTTNGDKEKGDFLTTMETAANAAKLVAVYDYPSFKCWDNSNSFEMSME